MNPTMRLAATMAAAIFVYSNAWAAKDNTEITHDGKFIRLTGHLIEMTDARGKERSYVLALDAKITCDGEKCKPSDLKAGMRLRVTTKTSDKKVALQVEAIDKQESFSTTHVGKFIRIKGDQFEMRDSTDKAQVRTLAKDVTLLKDGVPCKSEDFKLGMKITATTEKNDANLVIRIETAEKTPEF